MNLYICIHVFKILILENCVTFFVRTSPASESTIKGMKNGRLNKREKLCKHLTLQN